MKPLQQFFMEEFRELYRSEKRWLLMLSEVERNLPPADMEQAAVRHLEQTVARVIRLEEIAGFIAASHRQESKRIQPLVREAGQVLTAVTRSTAAMRKQAFRSPPSSRGGDGSPWS